MAGVRRRGVAVGSWRRRGGSDSEARGPRPEGARLREAEEARTGAPRPQGAVQGGEGLGEGDRQGRESVGQGRREDVPPGLRHAPPLEALKAADRAVIEKRLINQSALVDSQWRVVSSRFNSRLTRSAAPLTPRPRTRIFPRAPPAPRGGISRRPVSRQAGYAAGEAGRWDLLT